MRTYLADLEERAYLVENTPPEAVGYREVTRDTGNDPLAAFAPKRAPAATPAPAPVRQRRQRRRRPAPVRRRRKLHP